MERKKRHLNGAVSHAKSKLMNSGNGNGNGKGITGDVLNQKIFLPFSAAHFCSKQIRLRSEMDLNSIFLCFRTAQNPMTM